MSTGICVGRYIIPKIVRLKEVLGRLADSMNDYLISIAKMFIVLLIKNIVFPLLFLYVAMKWGIVMIRHSTSFVSAAGDTKLELREELKNLKG